MILRALLLASTVAVLAPSTASAHDCATTCGDICYAPANTGYYRAEVLAENAGYPLRVRIVEHLSGSALAAVGDELEDVYTEQIVTVGTELFVSLAAYTDGTPGNYVFNVAREIVGGEIVCQYDDRNIPVDQFAAMAASPDCEAISEQLEIPSRPCDDTVDNVGCNAGAGGLGMGAVGALVLGLRRRRRA